MIIAYDWKTEIPGVFARHSDECPVRYGRSCTCGPKAYRASIREWETNRRVLSPDFPAAAEAQAWLRDQRASLEAAGRVALESGDLGAVVEEFLQAAEDGRVSDSSGGRYDPDGLRDLRGALSYVAAELGGMNIEDVDPGQVQQLVDRLTGSRLSAGRADSVVAGLHALFTYAIERDLVATDPVGDLTARRTTPDGNNSGQPGSEPSPPAVRRPAATRSRRQRSSGPTLDAVIRKFLRAADEGSIDRRPGQPYTSDTLLELRGSMSYVDDRLRGMAIGEIRRRHVQKLVDDLRSVGLPASVVATVVDSLRALYGFAIQRNLVDFSPVVELIMPLDDPGAGDDAATWSHVPPPSHPRPSTTTYSAPAPPFPATPPPSPQPAFDQPASSQSQPPPQAPDWELYGSRARETLAPTSAMMALGGRAVTWTTRLALVVFVLLVLVLARELGVTSLIQ